MLRARGRVARFYELEVIEGPLKDRRWKLVVGQRYRVGRTGREIPLFQDDAASLEHAEISWAADGWWIRDLGSEKGTQIDGVAVDETGRVFPVGALAVVGNTTLKLTMQHGIPAWVGWTAAIGVPVAATLVALTALAVKPIRYDPVVVFDRPVPQGDVTSSEVRIPDSFIRRFGVDHRTLAQRRITDFDADGRSELWLRVRDHEVVVEADGRDFETLGDLPTGCVDEATGLGFPDLKCGGVRWTFQGDRYVATELDGAVAWLAPLVDTLDPDSGATQRIASHPRPVRVSMLHPERLAGFLRGRGVVEPIHYLLCEEAVPGGKRRYAPRRAGWCRWTSVVMTWSMSAVRVERPRSTPPTPSRSRSRRAASPPSRRTSRATCRVDPTACSSTRRAATPWRRCPGPPRRSRTASRS
jgi:hypothetical protein